MMSKLNLRERLDDFWVYPKLSNSRHRRSFEDSFLILYRNQPPMRL